MYLTPRGEQLCTEAAATATASGRAVGHGGLYVRTRRGDVVHVSIPADCLAFQLGECAQVGSDAPATQACSVSPRHSPKKPH
jgi:hypothetical protein